MVSKVIKISFSDFWEPFDYQNNFIIDTLRFGYEVKVVRKEEDPDFLFYSCFGNNHFSYDENIIRIYYTGENDIPNFNLCDYGISFHNIKFYNRHLRLPLYTIYPSFNFLINKEYINNRKKSKEGFCSVLISNFNNCDPIRLKFLEKLNEYKTISSGGFYKNNVGGPVKDKLDFISRYRFNIAFENSSVPGYTTEKLIDPLAMGSVPIYWGNPLVEQDINPNSYININDFKDINEAIKYIKLIDNNEDLYLKYFNNDPLEGCPYVDWKTYLYKFLENIVENKKKQITNFGAQRNIMNKIKTQERLYSFKFLQNNLPVFEKIQNILNKNYKKFIYK